MTYREQFQFRTRCPALLLSDTPNTHEPLLVDNAEEAVAQGRTDGKAPFIHISREFQEEGFRAVVSVCEHCGGMYTYTEELP